MGFREGSYATVFKVEPGKGNSTKVNLVISKKKDGEYEKEFSGFCTFYGQAHAKAGQLKEKSRIKLGGTDVTTFYSKEKNKEYVTYKVFDFELQDGGAGNSSTPTRAHTNPAEDYSPEGDEDVPF